MCTILNPQINTYLTSFAHTRAAFIKSGVPGTLKPRQLHQWGPRSSEFTAIPWKPQGDFFASSSIGDAFEDQWGFRSHYRMHFTYHYGFACDITPNSSAGSLGSHIQICTATRGGLPPRWAQGQARPLCTDNHWLVLQQLCRKPFDLISAEFFFSAVSRNSFMSSPYSYLLQPKSILCSGPSFALNLTPSNVFSILLRPWNWLIYNQGFLYYGVFQ